MGYMSYDATKSGNIYEHYSDLGLVQKEALWSRVEDYRFDEPVIPRNSKTLEDYDASKILREYSARNSKSIYRISDYAKLFKCWNGSNNIKSFCL